MKLTPLDIHHKEFRNALRGYNPEEVDDFLDEVADEFERLFKENIDLKEAYDAAQAKLAEYTQMEHTLQNTLISAQQSAEDIMRRARTDSERILRDADSKAQEVVSTALEEKQHAQAEVIRLQGAEADFRARFQHMLETYLGALAPAAPEVVAAPAAAAAEPVVEADGAAQLELDDEPAPAEPVTGETEPLEPVMAAAVSSLTLGEFGDEPAIEDEDIPTLEVPAEFQFPKPGAHVGELDDLDIEEID